MSETKRSKRHRRHRNHISAKDMVSSSYSFAAHAKKVLDEHKKKYSKNTITVAKGFEHLLGRHNP